MKKLLLLLLVILCTGCYVTSQSPGIVYEDHPHTTEIYYNGVDIYFGFYSGFYYYYGKPHFYPWWYYYQFIPPHHYYTHSHIHIHCDNGHYVYGHRGPLFHNTGPDCTVNGGQFKPTIKIRNKKDKSFVYPKSWKSSNSTRINKQNSKVNYNINKINYNRTFNHSKNTINNKPNKINNNNRPKNNNRSNKSKRR